LFAGSKEAIRPGDSGQHWRLPCHGSAAPDLPATGEWAFD